MDTLDRKILHLIQSDPDLAIHEIAERVGLSHTPCWRRIKRLESDGVIKGRVALLDAVALGLNVNVLARVKLQKHDEATLNSLEAAVGDHPQIVECFSMSGDSDYIMRVVVSSIEDYERFLKQTLLHLPGVGSINSSFALKCIKSTTMLPL